MNRVAAFAAVLALCIAGMLIGAFAVHLYYLHHGNPGGPWTTVAPGPGPGPMTNPGVERVARELRLTPEQRVEFRRILGRARRDADALRAEMLPQLHELMEHTREELEVLLTPEQMARFRELHREDPGMGERFLLGHGPPRRHPEVHP